MCRSLAEASVPDAAGVGVEPPLGSPEGDLDRETREIIFVACLLAPPGVDICT